MIVIARFSITVLMVFLFIIVHAQRGIKWAKDGNSYYMIENNGIVQYKLPSFDKTTVAESAALTPLNGKTVLAIRSFSFSDDGSKLLIYTNTKRVWRQDTRGDYWVLNLTNNNLKQLGKSKPASSLMFAKLSPDGTKAAYVSEHNIFMEDLLTNKIIPLTKDGSYTLSPQGLYATHSFSNYKNERASGWISLPNHQSIKVNAPANNPGAATAATVEMFQVTTEDGITMDGWMIKPKNFDSTKKYPVLFHVYAEPAGTTVRDAAGSAGTNLYAGDIAADGYIQMSVEGRGAPSPKGAAWRKAIYRKIGIINIRDQAMAAKKIMQWKFVDTSRIAVHGWSGGGSTTLNLLFQYPEIYKTGISIAPVPNQLLYDNIYQERYMGLPQENREDFLNGSPLTHAKNLRGNLLVVHGTGDDNVHYQGTEMLINELVKWNKPFQMMAYPNRTHGISEGEGTSKHLSNLFTAFLREHCPGGGR